MNFLLINGDQFRHDCMGFRGLRGVKTPNLDSFAEESIVYTNAFTPLPVCAPARQSLLCGRHPDSFGAMWNYDQMPTPTVQPEWCWPSKLADAGVQTAYLGRFHVSPTLQPKDFGYQKHVSWAGHKQILKEKYSDVTHTGGWLGCESPIPVEDSGTHWMADRACEVLEEFCAAGKPWHIWVDYEEPHLPCRPSAPFSQMYRPEDIEPWPGFGDTFENKPYCHKQQTWSWDTADLTWDDLAPMVARYYGVVSQLDDAIGRIIQKLKSLGQWEDTIVVFTSDHGDMCGSHNMLDKHYVLYDDIIRVPLLVHYPGVAHMQCDSFVSNCLDIPACITQWFGLSTPEVVHGKPLPMTKEEDQAGRDCICATSNGQQFGLYSTRALRDHRYKYVWNLTDNDELYDLVEDPGEKKNLIAEESQKERITAMRHKLHALLSQHGDPFVKNEWMKRQLLDERKHLR